MCGQQPRFSVEFAGWISWDKRPSEHRWRRHAPHRVRAGGPGGESGRGPGRDWGEVLVVSQKKTKCLLCGHKDSSATSTASCPTWSGQGVRAGSPGGGPGAIGGRFYVMLRSRTHTS